jgi:hypothetical protein
VVDVQLASDVYRKERIVYHQVREGIMGTSNSQQGRTYISRDLLYPSVYDSLTVVRPSVNFREGLTLTNSMSQFHNFIMHIPYHETYLLAVTYLIPAAYGQTLKVPVGLEWTADQHDSVGIIEEAYTRTDADITPEATIDIILGFSALYLMVRTYSNSLIAEVSQQLYGGILRCIALGPTEGLSTWKCNIQLNIQPVVVPVGRMSLGRILNVVGAAVDLYMEQQPSLAYGVTPVLLDRSTRAMTHVYTLGASECNIGATNSNKNTSTALAYSTYTTTDISITSASIAMPSIEDCNTAYYNTQDSTTHQDLFFLVVAHAQILGAPTQNTLSSIYQPTLWNKSASFLSSYNRNISGKSVSGAAVKPIHATPVSILRLGISAALLKQE